MLLVGPRTVALSTSPYEDWNSAAPLLQELLQRLNAARLFEAVERIGLRYINFFERLNILDCTTLVFEIRGRTIANDSVALRAEALAGEFKVVTQIANRAEVQRDGGTKHGSILDLDVIGEPLNLSGPSLPTELMSRFVAANALADVEFFRVLSDDLVKTFGPEY